MSLQTRRNLPPQKKLFFLTLKRLKTCMRSTILDNRLNHLMMLHVHKEHTGKIDIFDVCFERFAMIPEKSLLKDLFFRILFRIILLHYLNI